MTLVVASLLLRTLNEAALETYQQEQRADVVRDIAAVRAAAETAINKRVYLALGLRAYVSVHPDMTSQEFADIAGALRGEVDGIRSVTSIKDNIINDVFPRDPDTLKALGLKLLSDPDQRTAAERAIETGRPWLAGPDFTALDAFFAPVAFHIRTYGLDVGRGQAWVEHMLAHPAMLAWEEAALAETWREVSHEEELLAAGTVVADFRAS